MVAIFSDGGGCDGGGSRARVYVDAASASVLSPVSSPSAANPSSAKERGERAGSSGAQEEEAGSDDAQMPGLAGKAIVGSARTSSMMCRIVRTQRPQAALHPSPPEAAPVKGQPKVAPVKGRPKAASARTTRALPR